jgi:hypothetical protein
VSDDDRTKAELQAELRERDLPVSGTKQELIDRLADADEADETDDTDGTDGAAADADETNDETNDEGDISTGTDQNASSGKRKGPKPLQLAQMAARQLEQVSGRRVDGVTSLEQADEGWRIGLDLVEIARIPPATDVLGNYEVVVDEDGDLVRYERIRRFIRGQAGEDQG